MTSANNGMPMNGATLHIAHAFAFVADGKTDGDGHAALPAITSDVCEVEVTAPGKAKVSKSINLTRADETPADFALPEGGSICGTVTDADGNAVVGATVTYYGHSTRAVVSAKAGEDGAYRLDNLQTWPDSAEQVIVRDKGWAPIAISITPGTKQEPAQVDAQLTEKGHTIVGRVVNETNEPIKDVVVTAGRHAAGDNRAVEARTDEDGHFKFDSLALGATFDFYAQGYTEQNWQKLQLDRPDEVTVEMRRLACIVGKVVDADTRQPVSKFNVKMQASNMSVHRLEIGEDFGGPTGVFRLDDLQSGVTMTLVISSDGYPVQYFDNIATGTGQDDPIDLKLSKK